MFMSKTENLIIIMLISILLIPVYPSIYPSHASFSIIIKSTTTHFFLFFSLRELRIWGIIFFSLSLPPSFPHCQQSPFLLCMPLSPLCLLFFQYYCYFLSEQPVGTSTEERASKTHNPSLSDATKKHYKQTLKTITYYFMHKLKPYVTCTIIIVSFAYFFPA